MTPEDSDDLVAKLIAAPPRDKRLTPGQRKQPRPAAPVLPAPASFSASSVTPSDRARHAGGSVDLEHKVAALSDPAEILRLVGTEAALRRAQRLTGGGEQQRHMMRLLSVLMLFALVIAAVGAMWYLQTSLSGGRRHPRAATANPAPAASAAPADPARRSPAPAD